MVNASLINSQTKNLSMAADWLPACEPLIAPRTNNPAGIATANAPYSADMPT